MTSLHCWMPVSANQGQLTFGVGQASNSSQHGTNALFWLSALGTYSHKWCPNCNLILVVHDNQGDLAPIALGQPTTKNCTQPIVLSIVATKFFMLNLVARGRLRHGGSSSNSNFISNWYLSGVGFLRRKRFVFHLQLKSGLLTLKDAQLFNGAQLSRSDSSNASVHLHHPRHVY